LKAIQTKIDCYMDFLKTAQSKLITCGLPAWKHRKELESLVPDLPNAAKGLHRPPAHMLAEVLCEQINDPTKKDHYAQVLGELVFLLSEPTPMPSPRASPQEYQIDQDDEFQDDVFMEQQEASDSFEIPQLAARPEEVTSESELAYLRELEAEIETPVLPKRQRITGKTPHNMAMMGKGKGSASEASRASPAMAGPVPSSDDDSSLTLSKREKREAAKQRKKDALLAASPPTAHNTRKSINKPKQR